MNNNIDNKTTREYLVEMLNLRVQVAFFLTAVMFILITATVVATVLIQGLWAKLCFSAVGVIFISFPASDVVLMYKKIREEYREIKEYDAYK